MESGQWFDLTKAASEFGPFLFAILYIIIVPPYSLRKYRGIAQQFCHPSAAQLAVISESRAYFRSSWIAGLVLVFCSVAWWLYAQWYEKAAEYYVAYEGLIYGVHNDDEIAPDLDAQIYLMKTMYGKDLVYRFVVLEKRRLLGQEELTLRWINVAATTRNANGFGGTTLPFMLKPSSKDYEFVSGADQETARIVPTEDVPKKIRLAERSGVE